MSMDNLLEPCDFGINACARCGCEFHGGEFYRRGIARTAAALMLYITCLPCAELITNDEDVGDEFLASLRARMDEAILAGAPPGGTA